MGSRSCRQRGEEILSFIGANPQRIDPVDIARLISIELMLGEPKLGSCRGDLR